MLSNKGGQLTKVRVVLTSRRLSLILLNKLHISGIYLDSSIRLELEKVHKAIFWVIQDEANAVFFWTTCDNVGFGVDSNLSSIRRGYQLLFGQSGATKAAFPLKDLSL